MIYLGKIIDFLNSVVKDRLSMYPTADYKGVATYATKVQKQGIIVYPTAIPFGGTGAETLTLDIRSPFNIYHRLGITSFSAGEAYGDDLSSTISTTDLQMIVWGVRKSIGTTPEQLALIMTDVLPDLLSAPELSAIGVTRIKVFTQSITYDQRTVFAQEMQGIKYFLGPELFLFSIRYRIEGTYNKGCLNTCDC